MPEQRRATEEPHARVALDAASRRRVEQPVRRRARRDVDDVFEVRIPERSAPLHDDGCARRDINDGGDARGGEVVD